MALSAAVQTGLERATNRLRAWVDHRIDEQALDLARLYQASRETLGSRLRMVYENFLGGEPTLVKARQSPAARQLDQAIAATVDELTLSVGTRTAEALQAVNGMSAAAVNRFLAPWTGLPVAELPVSSQWVLQELSTTLTGGGSAFDRFFHLGEELKQRLASNVRQSLLNGEPFEDLRARIHASFGVDTLAEPKFNAYGSVQVYRNEARRQWGLLMQDHAEAVGALQVWWAELDDRTTPGCLARHGRAINELGDRPPRHTNCRCTILVAPAETGPESFADWRADADEWLFQKGFSRRQAAHMEAFREDAGFEQEHPRDVQGQFAFKGAAASFGRMKVEDLPGSNEETGPLGEYIFHTTARGNLEDIATDGLRPQGPAHRGEQDAWPDGGTEPRVYFTTRAAGALKFSEPDHALLRVKTDAVRSRGLRAEFKDADYYGRKIVPPNALEYLGEDRQWHPLTASAREAFDPAEHPRDAEGQFAFAGGAKKGVPAEVEQWVVASGGRVEGIQQHIRPGHPGFLVFTDDETGSSLLLPMDALSKTAIQTALEKKRAEFAAARGSSPARAAVEHQVPVPWWGSHRLVLLAQESLARIADPPPVFDDDGVLIDQPLSFRYQALPWRGLPLMLAQGISPAESTSSALEAIRRADPEAVLLRFPAQLGRVAPQRVDVLAEVESGWIPLQLPGATYVEVQPRRFVADAPVPVKWTPKIVQPSLEALARFPGLARLALVDHGTGWQGALVPEEQALPWAYAATADLDLPAPNWVAARGLPGLLDTLLATPGPPDPYLLLRDGDGLRTVFALASGQALYAREDFQASATYERVAVYCPEDDKVWAVRPRGHPYWVLPGGHIDPGESKTQAAVREMAEETGVPVVLAGYLGRLSRPWATTHVFLGKPSGPVGTPSTLDEIDGVAAIDFEDLDPSERQWLQARHPLAEAKAFDPSEHPRGEKGMFTFKGAGIAPSPLRTSPGGARVFTGHDSRRPMREKMTKLQVGRLGEDLAVDWLQRRGIAAARLEIGKRNNFPIDLVAWDRQGPVLYEVKAGRVSNSRGAQQWRVTLGKPGKKATAWLKTASPGAKRRYNVIRVRRALARKAEKVAEAEKILGVKVRLKTLAFIVDTDRKTADVHTFDGAHARVGWTSAGARAGYTGTVKYHPRSGGGS